MQPCILGSHAWQASQPADTGNLFFHLYSWHSWSEMAILMSPHPTFQQISGVNGFWPQGLICRANVTWTPNSLPVSEGRSGALRHSGHEGILTSFFRRLGQGQLHGAAVPTPAPEMRCPWWKWLLVVTVAMARGEGSMGLCISMEITLGVGGESTNFKLLLSLWLFMP